MGEPNPLADELERKFEDWRFVRLSTANLMAECEQLLPRILAALRAQSGDALVPREPTEAMIKAAEIMAERHDNRGSWIPKFWRAMYDAALATQGAGK